MRSNRTKPLWHRADTIPPDAPADRWSAATAPVARRSALLPLAAALIGLAIVAVAAYAASILFDVHPDRVIAGLFRKPTAAAPAATQSTAPPVVTPAPAKPDTPATGPAQQTAWPRAETRFPHPFALWRMLSYSLTDDAPDQPQPFQQGRLMSGDLQYIDGGAFQTEDTLVRLSGISSLPREAVCIGDAKAKFACGLMARASLSLLVSPERPRCYPDVSLATPDPAWLCTARGRLLSASQIEAGFALPSQPSIEPFVDLAAKARAGRVGAWNGDWTVVSPSGSGP